MDIILIAAVTADGFIARHSHEIVDWSEDLHVFKKQTMGYPVIMGSNTFESLQKELEDREIIVVHRNDNPEKIISKIKSDKCFVAGGGKTNTRFASYLTHIYLTPHPYIFGKGISLFDNLEKEFKLLLVNTNPIKKEITQFQYKVVY